MTEACFDSKECSPNSFWVWGSWLFHVRAQWGILDCMHTVLPLCSSILRLNEACITSCQTNTICFLMLSAPGLLLLSSVQNQDLPNTWVHPLSLRSIMVAKRKTVSKLASALKVPSKDGACLFERWGYWIFIKATRAYPVFSCKKYNVSQVVFYVFENWAGGI